MKRVAFWVGLFLGAGLLEIVIGVTVGIAWIDLGWRKPVADWLGAQGVPGWIAGYWGLVWIKLPDWVALFVLGAVIGRMSRPKRWLRHALAVGCGFIAYPVICSISYCLCLAESDGSLAVGAFWSSMAWDSVSLLLLVLAAWLFRRRPLSAGFAPVMR